MLFLLGSAGLVVVNLGLSAEHFVGIPKAAPFSAIVGIGLGAYIGIRAVGNRNTTFGRKALVVGAFIASFVLLILLTRDLPFASTVITSGEVPILLLPFGAPTVLNTSAAATGFWIVLVLGRAPALLPLS